MSGRARALCITPATLSTHSSRRTGPRVITALVYGSGADGSDALLDALFNAATASTELDLQTDVDAARGALTANAASRLEYLAAASGRPSSTAPLTALLIIVRGLDALSAANVTSVNALMRLLDQGRTADTVSGVLSLIDAPTVIVLLPYDEARAAASADVRSAAAAAAGEAPVGDSDARHAARNAVIARLASLVAAGAAKAAAVGEPGLAPIRAANPNALLGRVQSVVVIEPPAAGEVRRQRCPRRISAVADIAASATGPLTDSGAGDVLVSAAPLTVVVAVLAITGVALVLLRCGRKRATLAADSEAASTAGAAASEGQQREVTGGGDDVAAVPLLRRRRGDAPGEAPPPPSSSVGAHLRRDPGAPTYPPAAEAAEAGKPAAGGRAARARRPAK